MKRFLQILFLWIAGLGIVGHSLIPHHHHKNESEKLSCEQSCGHSHDASKAISFHNSESESHNHNADHEHNCSFQEDSIIKQTFPVLTAIITSILVIKKAETPVFTYQNCNTKLAVNPFYQSKTTRGPPAQA